jgi:hypothetical protein
MVDWCRIGPQHARVKQVREHPVQPRGMTSFEVR